MPWTPEDASKHIKGLSAKQARAWADIANKALASCLQANGTQAACEASAIKQANAVAQHVKESDLGPPLSAPEVGESHPLLPDLGSLAEAVTLKHRAQALLRDLNTLLQDKQLPQDMLDQLGSMRAMLQKKWADMADTPLAATTEAMRLALEATDLLRQDDSLDARRGQLSQAVMRWAMAQPPDADADPMDMSYPPMACLRDVFDSAVVFDWQDQCYRADYTLGADDSVTLGTPVPVEMAWVPMGEAMTTSDLPSNQQPAASKKADPKIPAADYAGKHESYPITTPQSVADAAQAIGRAGPDNYSTDELKARIIAIAHRKGAAFVAQLPKAWQPDAAKESATADSADLVPLVEVETELELVEVGAVVEWV